MTFFVWSASGGLTLAAVFGEIEAKGERPFLIMNTQPHRPVMSAAFLVMAAFFYTAALQAADAKDLNTIYQQGRAAFYRGDMEKAKALLQQVAAVKPDHFETKAMLAQIATYTKTDASAKKTYAAVTIPKIDFNDVTVAEAVQGLTVLGKNASGGKVSPNIILKDPEMGKKTVTLSLSNIPLTDAIEYVARMAGGRASYDKHAAVITSGTE